MVNANGVKKLAERLAKAEALVESGSVFPVAGLEDYTVVRNGDGMQMYLVRYASGHEHCTCPDYQHRQGKIAQPCKHILAAQLAATIAPKVAPAPVKRGLTLADVRTTERDEQFG